MQRGGVPEQGPAEASKGLRGRVANWLHHQVSLHTHDMDPHTLTRRTPRRPRCLPSCRTRPSPHAHTRALSPSLSHTLRASLRTPRRSACATPDVFALLPHAHAQTHTHTHTHTQGLAAYAAHAEALGVRDAGVFAFLGRSLWFLSSEESTDVGNLLSMVRHHPGGQQRYSAVARGH
jgi:hypothetical protein